MGDRYVQNHLDSRESIEGDLQDGVEVIEEAGGRILGGIDIPIRINNGQAVLVYFIVVGGVETKRFLSATFLENHTCGRAHPKMRMLDNMIH